MDYFLQVIDFYRILCIYMLLCFSLELCFNINGNSLDFNVRPACSQSVNTSPVNTSDFFPLISKSCSLRNQYKNSCYTLEYL